MENENIKKLEALERYVGEHFLITDRGIVRLLCAMVIANRLSGDPVWLFIVAPPSGLKTELINALEKVYGIYPLSSLTPKTLISGARANGGDASLLTQLKGDKILTFKDFTTILEMNYNARDEILSQLREIYDGKFNKSFGTGAKVDWKGKLGFLAGVTDAIELYQSRISIMGERFVQYRMRQPEREAAARMGLRNAGNIGAIREGLKDHFKDFLDGITIPDEQNMPVLPVGLEEDLIALSEFATTARAGVVRDSKDRYIAHVFPPEMPVRFAKQMILLCRAFLVMGSLGDCERAILKRIAMSSVFRNRRRVLLILAKSRQDVDLTGKASSDEVDSNNSDDDFGFDEIPVETEKSGVWTTKDLALALDMPTTTTRRICEDLTALSITKRFRIKGNLDAWELQLKYKTLLDNHYRDYEVE